MEIDLGTVFTVIIAVLVFGFLIFIHEFGHYITARIFKVTIDEFSIGMGPRLFSYESKKTGIRYSLAALPIGGYVAMAGEAGETGANVDENGVNTSGNKLAPADDPNTFDKKPAWQRFIITLAGAFVNIVCGFLAMIILTSILNLGTTTVGKFAESDEYAVSSADSGLMINDEIIRVNGKRVRIFDELSYEIMRQGNEPIDLTVIRDGKELLLKDVVFPGMNEQGQSFGAVDFIPYGVRSKDFGTVMKFSWLKSTLIVRMCWESLYDLITGRYTLQAVSGPVGIASTISSAAAEGFASFLYIVTLISINLGVMNLLPIPALDGGRLFTLLIEMVTRKKLPQKVEGIINTVGLGILLLLSLVIMVKDIVQLIL